MFSRSSELELYIRDIILPEARKFEEYSIELGYSINPTPNECFKTSLMRFVEEIVQERRNQRQVLQEQVTGQETKLRKMFESFWKVDLESILETHKHRPLFERKQIFTKLLEGGKEQKAKRKEEVRSIIEKINRLAALLSMARLDPYQKKRDISDEAVGRYQQNLLHLQQQYTETVEQTKQTCAKIASYFQLMELKREMNDELHLLVFNGYCDESRCRDLVGRREDINAFATRIRNLKKSRTQSLYEYAAEILALWDQLGVQQEAQERFYDENSGLGERVIAACSEELKRLLTRRGIQLNDLLDNRQKELNKLWKLHKHHKKSEEQSFFNAVKEAKGGAASQPILVNSAAMADPNTGSQAFYNKTMERQLALYEQEIARVTACIQMPITEKIKRRNELLAMKAQLDAQPCDPKRLQSRDRETAQQLRQENALRERLKTLPKLTQAIQKDIGKFMSEMRQPFLIDGEDYLAVMKREEDMEKQAREAREQARKAVPVQANQENFPRVVRAPPPPANRVAQLPRTPGRPQVAQVPGRTPGITRSISTDPKSSILKK